MIYLSLLVAVIGLVVWLAADHPKVSDAGRIAYFCGLFAFLFQHVTKVL